MKVVILAGGRGTRISEESHLKPKPMIEVGDHPILWHIMKSYSHYGYNDFVLCCGYKGFVIKEYFNNYFLHMSDVTFDFSNNNGMSIHHNIAEPWRVTLVDTGMDTMTGGRVKRIQKYIGNEPFMLTYGDGVSDIHIDELVRFHKAHGKAATITAIQPEGRFGALDIDAADHVTNFIEKPKGDGSWINGGFMVLEPEVFDYLEGDETVFEQDPMRHLAENGQMCAYRHTGFWKPMDTLRDKVYLDSLWNNGEAPWKIW